MSPVDVRTATEADLPAILAIYNYEVLNGVATFDVEPRSLAAWPSSRFLALVLTSPPWHDTVSMARLTIFLDHGGVMNDNTLGVGEWQRLVGQFFAPRLGGAAEKWAQVNREMFPDFWDRQAMEQARLGLVDEYVAWSRQYQIDWLRTMSGGVGMPAPEDDDEAFRLAQDAALFVTSRCDSAFPDAVAGIQRLHEAGFTMNTSSGTDSRELDGYLTRMGVRDRFTHLFGPDLVDAFKAGPQYYSRAFAMAAVEPHLAVVVDDSPQALTWAAAAGALTVLVDRAVKAPAGYEGRVISGLAALPALVAALEADAL